MSLVYYPLQLDMYDLLTQSFSRATVPAADNKHRELLGEQYYLQQYM